ncbi:MAG: 4Fe-4S binding protein, partial [Verrucomicrobiota bacterium]
IQLRIAAYLCGLGEIGYSKMFLSPQFGPRNRVGIVITDAKLKPDPIYNGPKLCNRCMACVQACPGNAIHAKKTVKVKLAGRDVKWGELDCNACTIAFCGGLATDEPVSEDERYMGGYGNVRSAPWSPFYKKPANVYNTGQAVCGGRGCMRACMISLEKRGVLQNKFKEKFRRRKPWSVDWSTTPAYPADAMMDKTASNPMTGSGKDNASTSRKSEEKEAD